VYSLSIDSIIIFGVIPLNTLSIIKLCNSCAYFLLNYNKIFFSYIENVL